MNDLYKKIDSYLDGELGREEEELLFSGLAASAEARNYYRSAQMLKFAVKDAIETVPEELDRRILSIAGRREYTGRLDQGKFMTYAASAAAVILVALTIFMYGEFREYRYRLTEMDNKIKEQNTTIEMLYNSFPTVTVKPTFDN